MRWKNCSGGDAARANGLLLRFGLFCLLCLLCLLCFLSHSVLFDCGRPPRRGRLRPIQCYDHPIRLGLSATEPMIVVGSGSTKRPTNVSCGSFSTDPTSLACRFMS